MDPFGSSTFIDLLNSQTIESATDCEEVVEVKMKRRKWNPKDDIVLCSSWLNTSKDAVVANEQKHNAFWMRVCNYYNASSNLVGAANREPIQCKMRWQKINEVFDDVIYGRTPKVKYFVNGREYGLTYYLTDGIYPKWTTFIQSITLPQDPKTSMFATYQEAVRKDVERAFGVLQARFAIVKNPALFWDKIKIGKIMKACIILHNMIVEDERDEYTHWDISEFTQGDDTSPTVDYTFSTNMPSNVTNEMVNRYHLKDKRRHEQLKADLVEHIWQKFGS